MNDILLNGRLTAESLGRYFEAGTPVTLRVISEPECLLRIVPADETLELWIRHDRTFPGELGLSRVDADIENTDDGREWLRVSVEAENARLEAYSLLAAVIDDVADGSTNAEAVRRSIASFRDLLARRTRLGEQAVVGLIGELLVLESLAEADDPQNALDAWLGPAAEEHDFALLEGDVEVKTTISERRAHTIGNETQLLPSPERTLWLLSIQLTRGGADSGDRLGDVIARIHDRFPLDRRAIDLRLAQIGWHAQDTHLYQQRYMLRTTPHVYLVDEDFPAITRTRLDAVVPRPDLVGPVSYVVDVTSLAPSTPPAVLTSFVGEGLK